MRLSCCAYSFRQDLQQGRLSLEDFIIRCRELDLDGVELTSYYFSSTERAYLNRIKLAAHREGLAISGTAIGTDFADPDQQRRRDCVSNAIQWIGHSVTLGAPTMRVFAGNVRQGCAEEQAFKNVVDCLQECAAMAWEQGVLLALENHGGLTSTALSTISLLDAVASPAVGCNLDFGNFHGDIYGQFAYCAGRAVACHAKVTSEGAQQGERVRVDYSRVRTILEDSGYRGYIAIEYEEEEPAATGVPEFAALLRRELR
ncbi:MAG TPA: sugar phosphate isomerase/epimerase family protein [Chthonomonadales bacterium]|nr:sugar phosphate isomerase/epimerase family protein [Chthonomonadales bacterium]